MKIDVAYGRDLDDDMLKQLLYMEMDAYAYYDCLDADDGCICIGAIPTETLKHFKRRTANILFLMKTKKIKGKRTLIGMACVSKYQKDFKYLHTVYIKSDWRRKGIGTAIIKQALREAKKMKCALSLGVNPLNCGAIRLYEKLGFKVNKGQRLEMHALEKKNRKNH